MPKINLIFIVFLFVSCRQEVSPDIYSNSKDDIKSSSLIDPKEAFDLLEINNDYVAIQVSKTNVFRKQHIPGAFNIWRPDYGSDNITPYGGLIPSRERLENLLQDLGYEEGKTLLLYDTKANVDALRFAWILRVYGFHDYKIISGGLTYWKQSGMPVTDRKTEKPIKSNFILKGHFDDSIVANFMEVKNAINDTNTIIIDTREDYENKGEPYAKNGKVLSFKPGAFVRGSIPSAIHLNWSTLADLNGDHRIKSESNLRYDLENKGIDSNKDIILYCQSGSRTSHTFYVLKDILGYKNVKNYDGSWIEWSYKWNIDKSLPLEQKCSDLRFDVMLDSLNTIIAEIGDE